MKIIKALCLLLITVFMVSGCTSPNQPDKSAQTAPAVSQLTVPQTTQSAVANPDEKRRDDAGLLTSDKPSIDFGDVDPMEEFTGKFILRNVGKEPLTIIKTEQSCSCTVGKLDVPKVVQPGQSLPLDISFVTPANPGRIIQMVTLIIKAPAQPQRLGLTVTANVKKLVTFQPEQLEFQLRKDTPGPNQIVVESTDGKSFTLAGYSFSNNAVVLSYDTKAKATRHVLKVDKIDLDKLRLVSSGVLEIKVNHPKISSLKIPFHVITPFSVHPPTVRFFELQPGKPQTLTLSIVSNFHENFNLGNIKGDKGLVKVTNTDKTTDGYRLTLEMTVPGDSSKTIYMEQLTIEIADHPKDAFIVQCVGYVKK